MVQELDSALNKIREEYTLDDRLQSKFVEVATTILNKYLSIYVNKIDTRTQALSLAIKAHQGLQATDQEIIETATKFQKYITA